MISFTNHKKFYNLYYHYFIHLGCLLFLKATILSVRLNQKLIYNIIQIRIFKGDFYEKIIMDRFIVFYFK